MTLLHPKKCDILEKEKYALGGLRPLGENHVLPRTVGTCMRRVMYEKTR